MVDLGCQAGVGKHHNVSDALLWLDQFHSNGSTVYAVDAIEDYAHDLRYRFDSVAPYSSMVSVRKLTESYFLDRLDGKQRSLHGAMRKIVHCCHDHCLLVPSLCCGRRYQRLEQRYGSDHHCKIVRMRVGLLPPDSRTRYPSIHPPGVVARMYNNSKSSRGAENRYEVPSIRVDTLWKERLQSEHIAFLKVDVDASWTRLGLEGLFSARAFTVMTIEMDQSWGGAHNPPYAVWNVSTLDQLTWLAREHGYASYLKVPCRTRLPRDAPHNHMDERWSAYYHPLASPASKYTLTGYTVGADEWVKIHDVMLVDARAQAVNGSGSGEPVSLTAFLEWRGRVECRRIS